MQIGAQPHGYCLYACWQCCSYHSVLSACSLLKNGGTVPRRRGGAPGSTITGAPAAGTNHFGHFVLVNGLMDKLKAQVSK